MSADAGLTHGQRDALLEQLLRDHPDARVMALGPTGVQVPMPPSVPLSGSQSARTPRTTSVRTVVPGDMLTLVQTWERAREQGAASAVVHLVDDPDRAVTIHLIDVLHSHGALLSVVVGGDPARRPAEHRTAPAPVHSRPRAAQVRMNELGIYIQVDDAAGRIFGCLPEDLAGQRAIDLLHPDDQEPAIALWLEMLGAPEREKRTRLRQRTASGAFVWFDATYQYVVEEDGSGHVRAELIDITDQMAAEEALAANEQLLRRLTESLPLGILQLDAEQRIVFRNARLAEVLGVFHGVGVDDLLETVDPDDRPTVAVAIAAALSLGGDADLEVALRPSPRGAQRVAINVRPLAANGVIGAPPAGALVCVTDVTERTLVRTELEQRAVVDPLTGCHNRAILRELDLVLASPRGGGGTVVVLLDLDRFTQVNDRHGHAAGDELLRSTGRRMLRTARRGDLVGRIGGDEFLVVCQQVAGPEAALQIAERFAESVRRPVPLDGLSLPVLASVGAVWVEGTGIRAEELVAIATAAMQEARDGGTRHPVLHFAGLTDLAEDARVG